MLNFRAIDNKFCLSGGWTDVPKDVAFLRNINVKGVLDLQFSQLDYNRASAQTIKDECDLVGIEYQAIPLNDGYNDDIGARFEVAYATLLDWDTKFNKRMDRILVKCGVGVSRSVAVLTYFYCRRDGISYIEAKTKIQETDYINQSGLPISIDTFFHTWLSNRFKDTTYVD